MKHIPFLAFVVCSGVAQAQFSSVTLDGFGGGGGGDLEGTFEDSYGQDYGVVDGRHTFRFFGDMTFQASNIEPGEFFYQRAAFFTVTTGGLPVLLTDVRLNWNGKEVNSGAVNGEVFSYNFVRADMYVQGFSSDTGYATFLDNRSGQGFWIEDLEFEGVPSSTILNANTAYRVYMDVYPIYTFVSGSASQPGYALEYGGDLTNGSFDGLTFSFEAQAVPEPASMVALAGLGLAALRSRLRRA